MVLIKDNMNMLALVHNDVLYTNRFVLIVELVFFLYLWGKYFLLLIIKKKDSIHHLYDRHKLIHTMDYYIERCDLAS
jgi:hypothetical protein